MICFMLVVIFAAAGGVSSHQGGSHTATYLWAIATLVMALVGGVFIGVSIQKTRQ
jgi:hypothetical protein